MSRHSWVKTKRATTISEDDGMLACTYHTTSVVKWDADKVRLNSGGFQTVTTKRRMNEVSDHYGLGFRVYQVNFEWFVRLPSGEVVKYEDRMEFPR